MRWRPPINASVSAAMPLVIDDYIFLSTSYDRGAVLLQFNGKSLKQIWSGDDQLSNHYATSVYSDGHLYGFHGRQEQGCDLRCVELKTGKVKWSQDQFGAGTVTLVNNELFVLSEKGELVRAPATPSGFKPSARAQILSFQVRAYPAIANGRLYARSKDRLVCADGGNPDPTTTHGKDPQRAKALELAGWPYPRHLAGRAFAVVAHGDSQGHEDLRRSLTQWLTDIGMSQAGDSAAFDTLIGYYEPYAVSHDKLDAMPDVFTEVEHAARSLVSRVRDMRSGTYKAPDAGLRHPRQK